MMVPKPQHLTSGMIYVGTFLIAILSFFTTLNGLAILVSWPLAIIGSLGIQTALLGIAWNIMRVRGNRLTYVVVFLVAATFSIFFSYANFNFMLKANTRGQKVRSDYADAARPVIRRYGTEARQALAKGNYQRERVGQLIKLEEEKGWATIVDEGSQDAFVQSIIDGARRTVDSWKRSQGSDYRQGAGRGIISNYLDSWSGQVDQNLRRIESYITFVDSTALVIAGSMPVVDQYELVNQVTMRLPAAEMTMMASAPSGDLPEPPSPASFIETPMNQQEALMLVIGDLYEMDKLTFFSLMFAVGVDLIVIVMALAGGGTREETDYLFSRVQKDSHRRTKKVDLDDPRTLSDSLAANIERLQIAGRYGIEVSRLIKRFERRKAAIHLVRGPESPEELLAESTDLISHAGKWSRLEREQATVAGGNGKHQFRRSSGIFTN